MRLLRAEAEGNVNGGCEAEDWVCFWSLLVADEPGSGIPGSRYKEVGCRGRTGVWYPREPLGR